MKKKKGKDYHFQEYFEKGKGILKEKKEKKQEEKKNKKKKRSGEYGRNLSFCPKRESAENVEILCIKM